MTNLKTRQNLERPAYYLYVSRESPGTIASCSETHSGSLMSDMQIARAAERAPQGVLICHQPPVRGGGLDSRTLHSKYRVQLSVLSALAPFGFSQGSILETPLPASAKRCG